MGIYIKGDFKNPYPNCDECIFGEIIQCEAMTRREVYDYDVDCPLSEIEVSEDCISREWIYDALLEYGFTAPDMTVTELIEETPSVVPTVRKNRTVEQSSMVGEWIPCTKEGLPLTELGRREGQKWYGYKCSKCNFIYKGNALTESPFCQNCGAMMNRKMKG